MLFLDMKNIYCDILDNVNNEEWLCDFAFAVDILQKMNELKFAYKAKMFLHMNYLRQCKHLKENLNFFQRN